MFIKLKLSFFIFLLTFFIIGCSESPTDSKPKPPGYQEDIPWPSLADSPWPMNRHDPQATGRSPYEGPSEGVIEWVFSSNLEINTGVVIGIDNSIYFSTSLSYLAGLLKLNEAGTLLDSIRIGSLENYLTPIVVVDGSIIATNAWDVIYKIAPDGQVIWKKEISGGPILTKSFIPDKEENLYYLSADHTAPALYCLDENGDLKWEHKDERFIHSTEIQPAFAPEGKTLYITSNKHHVIAFDIEQKSIKWTYGDSWASGLAISAEGYIFGQSEDELFSLNNEGDLQWKYKSKEPGLFPSPTIDKSGNVYFGTDTLYSFSYDGNLNWKKELNGSITSIIVDKKNKVYVATLDNMRISSVYSLDSAGNILWIVNLNDTSDIINSPAISNNNRIILSTYHGKIYSIK